MTRGAVARSLVGSTLRAASRRSPLARVLDDLTLGAEQARDELVASRPTRAVYQMRISLPAPRQAEITSRALRPRGDLERLAYINEAVFAWHPDQAYYGRAGLEARVSEPGFDPELVRVHEVGGCVTGYCWGVPPRVGTPLGTIDVVAVDPRFAGQGIGRGLILATLERLAAAAATTAVLYVDAGNTGAARLYLDMGWTLWRVQYDHTRGYIDVSGRRRDGGATGAAREQAGALEPGRRAR